MNISKEILHVWCEPTAWEFDTPVPPRPCLMHCRHLQAIQDMNNLKRFIRQAEMSHYALFRCCLFLQACGNGDVLLRNARAEHSGLPEACDIIRVLEEFLSEQAQGAPYWAARGSAFYGHIPAPGDCSNPLNISVKYVYIYLCI